MKAITLWQPWASLLACGAKQYETRSWATNYRGPIAIHAAITRKYYCTAGYQDIMIEAAHDKRWQEYLMQCADTEEHEIPFGAVIATAELVECHRIQKDPKTHRFCGYGNDGRVTKLPIFLPKNEYLFGDWTPGRFAWEFANMKILVRPVPAKGKQGLWEWEESAE